MLGLAGDLCSLRLTDMELLLVMAIVMTYPGIYM